MEIERKPYNFEDSLHRIDRILGSYVKNDKYSSISKAKEKLSVINGALIDCTAMTILFYPKGNGNLLSSLKVVRAFSSEVINILSGTNNKCSEVIPSNDKIIAIYDTPLKTDIEHAIDNAAAICTLSDVISKKAENSGYPTIDVNIGIDYGETLMMDFKPFDLNKENISQHIQYKGQIISNSERYARLGFECNIPRLWVSPVIYNNLSSKYKGFFKQSTDNSFNADLCNTHMKAWVLNNQ